MPNSPLALYAEYASGITLTMERMPWENVHYMVEVLHEARLQRRAVFVLGNGGSAATASHLVCDLDKNTASAAAYPRFRVMALNDNMALLSALANDCGYETVFAEQLKNFLQRDDVVIAISTSGNSPNVLQAVDYAKQAGAFTIGWAGYQGGQLAALVDLPVIVPNHSIEQIEDIHLMLGHMVTQALRTYSMLPDTVEMSYVWRVPAGETANGNGRHNGSGTHNGVHKGNGIHNGEGAHAGSADHGLPVNNLPVNGVSAGADGNRPKGRTAQRHTHGSRN
ncbi:MAG: SIS domain-containing protein [Caldilineaceae bacterium]|nr:SIS domain-containing protein [Caldilineaceae bacterium]